MHFIFWLTTLNIAKHGFSRDENECEFRLALLFLFC